MMPRHDIEPCIDVDPSSLRVPSAYDVAFGFSDNREYEPLIDVSWDEAHDCLQAEARWLRRAMDATTVSEFDDVLAKVPDQERATDDFDWLFRHQDVGVAGLVLGLNAAGYATCYSCRGHADLPDRVPQVRLTCAPERLPLLLYAARNVGCGAQTDDYGLLNLYAPSADRLHRLAQVMLAHRAGFAALRPEPWHDRALAALEQGAEEFEWRDDEL
jgi:hypothetical protein